MGGENTDSTSKWAGLPPLENTAPKPVSGTPFDNVGGANTSESKWASLPALSGSATKPFDGDLPWYKDIPLAAASYGITHLAGALSPIPGSSVAAKLAAPLLYLKLKSLLTGKPIKPRLAQMIPGTEDMNPTVLGSAEEMALWMLPRPLLKGAGKFGKFVDRTVLQNVGSKVISRTLEPAGEWAWRKLSIIPDKISIPGTKSSTLGRNKTLTEVIQPAIERLEKQSLEVAGTIRGANIAKALTTDIGKEFSDKLAGATPPQVLYEVIKGIKKNSLKAIKSPEAKQLINEFRTNIMDKEFDSRYVSSLQKNLVKLFPSTVQLSAKMEKRVLNMISTPKGASLKDIHNTLRKVINNPDTSPAAEKARQVAKDIWNLPANTPLKVAEASRSASLDLMTNKIKTLPGAISATPRAGYVESRIGSLKGAYVHKDIELELEAIQRLPKIAEGVYQKFFLTPWKTSKVILRPASHMRNMVSNIILNDWGGLPFYRMDIYIDAFEGLTKKSSDFKDFSRLAGMSSFNYTQADLSHVRTGLKYGSSMFDKALHTFDTVVTPVRSLYNAEESLFKFAKYLHNIEKGMSKEEAAHDAIKWTFNFSEVTPEVAQIGKYAMPFVRWYSKVIPMGLETVVKHPARFGKWLGFAYALQSHALENNHVTEKEWETLKTKLPEYMQRGFYLLMPYRDDKKRLQMLDLTNVLPFIGDVSELYGKSPLDVVMNNPIFTVGSSIMKNKKFSEAPIYYEWEEPRTKLAKVLAYAWEQLTPAALPGGTDWNKLYKTMMHENDLTPEQAIGSMFGMKLIPLDAEANERRRNAIMKIYDREIKNDMYKHLRGAKTGKEQEAIVKEAMQKRFDIRGIKEKVK